ncbi:HK97 family phage major capsid protein [Actinotalea ferrariae CF5-4]|uniref:HK97 family phage major capsid protein n=1 Tax=Actinotalea ferrariae CF5-4 TaxID=948458 RepID=A0A021VTX6_9CELL|nr:phage major capsid protein [Actinotalea ferrariae]EYR64649.1 HK97 family phage major capsid protein [Actinotalea ferrariae CF5-4]
MNARLRKLLEQRATAWSQVQDIQARRAADGFEPTAEDGEAFTRALDEVQRLSDEIETEERAARLGAGLGIDPASVRGTTPRPGEDGDGGGRDVAEEYRSAFDGYLRRGMGQLSGTEQQLLERGYVEGEEFRALGASVDAAGGYTVPKEFLDRMIEALKSFGGILSVASVINTTTGAPLSWPTNDDTANKGAILAENTQVTEQDFVFGSANLGAHMYTSKMVRVARQLLQDSAFNLAVWLPRKLGERIGRAAGEHFAVGTGTGQPQGLITGLTKGVTSGTIGKVGYDDLVELEHSIDAAYRTRASYVLADSALRELRKLKDSQGRPLWVAGMAGGVPSTINGRPYIIDNDLPVQANGSKSIVYGDIEAAYVVRVVAGAQTLRLNERYADYLQVGFLGFQRLDGKVQDTSAAAVLTVRAA